MMNELIDSFRDVDIELILIMLRSKSSVMSLWNYLSGALLTCSV